MDTTPFPLIFIDIERIVLDLLIFILVSIIPSVFYVPIYYYTVIDFIHLFVRILNIITLCMRMLLLLQYYPPPTHSFSCLICIN